MNDLLVCAKSSKCSFLLWNVLSLTMLDYRDIQPSLSNHFPCAQNPHLEIKSPAEFHSLRFSYPLPNDSISCGPVIQVYQPEVNIPPSNHLVYMDKCIWTWILANISSKLNIVICNIWKYMTILFLHLVKSTVMSQDNVIIKV